MFAGRARILLGLVGPIIAASAVELVFSITDAAIVGRLGTEQLAAVGAGAAIYMVLVQVIAASAMGYQIVAAKAYGASRREDVAEALAHTLPVTLTLAAIGVVILWASAPLIVIVAKDPSVSALTLSYLMVRSPALLLFGMTVVLRTTFDTATRTRIGMLAALAATAVNLPIAFALAFGIGPFPRLEILGTAAANVIGSAVSCAIFATVLLRARPIPVPRLAWRPALSRRLLGLSAPEMLNTLQDYTGSVVFVSLAATFGTASLAGSRIAWVTLSVLFVFAYAFGYGVQILVGRAYGRGDLDAAAQELRTGRSVGALALGAGGLLIAAFPNVVVAIFGSAADVSAASEASLRVLGLSAPAMAWATCHQGTLRALGRTRVTALINFGAVWLVELPVAWFFGVKLGLGLAGLFAGFLFYFVARAIIGQILAERALREGRPERPPELLVTAPRPTT